ncbi:MAG: carbon-nitrogen hydrolase family protein [Croceitalea sp.]|nr:carbon-nitrogen hydrolase family protein [Croceitalea sp.]NNC34307.1 carbon-nitrogen hydrolase family protein [Croceitalea sp.]NNL09964.1 carbon-nitrogen hydrolase family protein [Croceitalea sp.]
MKVKVGVVQESPIFFDKAKTMAKLTSITKKYAAEGCQLLVFPESFVPGYPRGFTFGATVGSRTEEGKKLFAKYHENSVFLAGEDGVYLEALAKKHQIYLVIGITEKVSNNGSLYCSMVYISPTAGILGVHRKIKPTGTERIIWAEADGSSLTSVETKIGKLGGLICWENYMPLARMAMYNQGIEIYIAPTADSREAWTDTMKHIALEGRCFVLGCNQYYTKSMYPKEYQSLVEKEVENLCPGGSVIVSPMGKVLNGPLFGNAGVLIAELDLEEVQKSKLDFDVVGHYARNDIFKLSIKDQPQMIKEPKLPRT